MPVNALLVFALLLIPTACSDRSRPERSNDPGTTLDRGVNAYPVEIAEVEEEEVVEWIGPSARAARTNESA